MTITYRYLDSPLGRLLLAACAGALRGAWFEGQAHGPTLTAEWHEAPRDPLLDETEAQFAAWFAGTRRAFHLPLAPQGTDFQRAVWREIARLPFGSTAAYGQVARGLGHAAAARAVGAATGRNPLSIIIPCHRLVAGNGALTGYAGGLARKAALLRFEAGEAGAWTGARASCASVHPPTTPWLGHTEHFAVTRDFLNNYPRRLEPLLDDETA